MIIKTFSAIAVLVAAVSAANASEAVNRDILCHGMRTEVTLPNGTRADCISDVHAIEVDWTGNWAEALGQSLSYAASTGKIPGIFLVCKAARKATCDAHYQRLRDTINAWGLHVDVWVFEDQS